MDRMDANEMHKLASEIFDKFWDDSQIIEKDYRGKEIVRQLLRSLGSISANIEEGYGRGFLKARINSRQKARDFSRVIKGSFSAIKALGGAKNDRRSYVHNHNDPLEAA